MRREFTTAVAGIVLHNDRVVETTPILRYMRGWTRHRVRVYCQNQGLENHRGSRIDEDTLSFWAVVQTETQREHIARLLLMRGGYETYAPRIKIKQRISLLFPSYIFCRVIDRWYPILWTPAVLRVLMSGERPAPLDDRVITGLRRREIGGFVKLPSKHMRKGTKLKVIRGPFEGHIVLHDEMTGLDRQRVLLAALGQDVTLELPKKDLAVIQPLAFEND